MAAGLAKRLNARTTVRRAKQRMMFFMSASMYFMSVMWLEVVQGVQMTVMESKHSALFWPVPPVWPSSQIVMFVLEATTVPLKFVQLLPVTVAGGFKLIAVAQLVEAVGLTFTVQVEYSVELPRNQPATV